VGVGVGVGYGVDVATQPPDFKSDELNADIVFGG
jgi:hypothetical protein